MAHDKSDARFGASDQRHEPVGHDPREEHDPRQDAGPGTVVLHQERLVPGVEKVRASAVRMRVTVVTEETTVTVPLRREVLEIIELDDDPDTITGATGLRKPREIVLHEERLAVETVAYERVRVTRAKVAEDVTVQAEVAREVLEVTEDRPR